MTAPNPKNSLGFDRAAVRRPESEAADLGHASLGEWRRDDAALLEGRPLVPGLAVDRRGTRVRDDAFWVIREDDGYRAYVSVSDVASRIPKGDTLDIWSCERLRDVKLEGGPMSPMLPRAEVFGRFSLSEGTERPTITVEIKFGHTGLVQSSRFYRSCIGNIQAANADQVFELRRMSKDNAECLDAAEELAKKLIQIGRSRNLQAVLGIRGILSKGGNSEEIEFSDSEAAAELTVAQLMLAANKEVAAFFKKQGAPAVYTTYGNLGAIVDASSGAEIEKNARLYGHLKTWDGEGVSPTPLPHLGVGEEQYLHFTSPIRNYADIVNQRILLALIDGQAPPHSHKEMSDLCSRINDASWSGLGLSRRANEDSTGDPRTDPSLWSTEHFSKAFGASLVNPDLRSKVIEEAAQRFVGGELSARVMAEVLLERDESSPTLESLKREILNRAFSDSVLAKNMLRCLAESGRLEIRDPVISEISPGLHRCLAEGVLEGGREIRGEFSANKKETALKRAQMELLAAVSGLPRASLPDQSEFSGKASTAPHSPKASIEHIRASIKARFKCVISCEIADETEAVDAGRVAARVVLDGPSGTFRINASASRPGDAEYTAYSRALRAVSGSLSRGERGLVSFEPRTLVEGMKERVVDEAIGGSSPKRLLNAICGKNGWGKPENSMANEGDAVSVSLRLIIDERPYKSGKAVESDIPSAFESASRKLLQKLHEVGLVSTADIVEAAREKSQKVEQGCIERLERFAAAHGLAAPIFKMANLAPSGGKGWRCDLTAALPNGKTIACSSDMPQQVQAKLKTAESAVKKILSLGLDI